MKKDILFLCQYFYPEHNSSATLPFDTARYFVKQGYQVGVLCGYPKEYFDGNEVPYEEDIDGIHIQRISYIQSNRAGKIGRLVNYLSFTVSTILSMKKFRDYRCIICYSNPPILPAAAMRAVKRFGLKLVFVVYDLYPEVAYASNSIKKGSVIDKVMRRINHEMYKVANRVIVLSEEMRDYILSNRPELAEDRVSVIYNWAHEENEESTEAIITCSEKHSNTKDSFSETHSDRQKESSKEGFCVSYFGNMGICQDIDTIMNAAEETVSDRRLQFKLIGHGNKKERIERHINERGLNNTKTYGYMTGTALRRELEESSCCVVSLTEGLKGMCAPSKYYTYLYAGKPIISVMETDSYISEEVIREGIGFAVKNGDSIGFEKAIRKMEENPDVTRAMGEKARELYLRKYRYEIAMSKYRDAVESVLDEG